MKISGMELRRVRENKWERSARPPLAVWASGRYGVALWLDPNGDLRLSIWRLDRKSGIAWETLQALKDAAGFGAWRCVEIYPEEGGVVNQANMRHLWLARPPLRLGW